MIARTFALICALVALFMTGCAQPNPEYGIKQDVMTLRINDEPKSPGGHSISEYENFIRAGAALWSDVGAVLVIDPSGDRLLECSTEPLDGGDVLAVTTAGGITADCDWLTDIADDNYETHLFAHELGHAWGLWHVADRHAIMYGGISNSLALTGDDLIEWFSVHQDQ